MQRMPVIAALGLAVALLAYGRPTYVGYSGAPGSRGTCASTCHGGSGGTITVSGFPTAYEPGQSYELTVRHTSGSTISNFNCSIRIASNSAIAGTITAGLNSATYTHGQEALGVHLSSSNKDSCKFTWTAPSPGVGDVKLYLAGLQGSSTGGPNTAIVLTASQLTGLAEGESGRLGHIQLVLAPSIVTRTLVQWVWSPDRDARLTVLDASGRVVSRVRIGQTVTAPRRVVWQTKDRAGRPLAGGAYLAVLETSDERLCRRFIVR